MTEARISRRRAPWWAWLVCVAVSLVGALALPNAVLVLIFEAGGGFPYGTSPSWYVPALVLGAVASLLVPVLAWRFLVGSGWVVTVAGAAGAGVVLVFLGLAALS